MRPPAKAGGMRRARGEGPDTAVVWRMSGLARAGAAEYVSRHEILRRERGQGETSFTGRNYFPFELTTNRVGSHTR